ncbi:hypothetical protein Hanom_Chr01g00088111 [Helianthus anomalus]
MVQFHYNKLILNYISGRVDILRRTGISAKKEAPVNFLTDPSEGRFPPYAWLTC